MISCRWGGYPLKRTSWGGWPLRRRLYLSLASTTLLLANLCIYLLHHTSSFRPKVSGSSWNTSVTGERSWRSSWRSSEVVVTPNTTLSDSLLKTQRRIQDRVALLRKECQGLRKPSLVKQMALDVQVKSRSEVLEDHKVMVCQVLKAGSSAWNYLLAHRYNMTHLLKNRLFYQVLNALNPSLKRFREVARSSDFVRFLVVRDPLERLLSAYRDRILDTTHVSWQAHHFVPLILGRTRGRSYSRNELYNTDGSVKVVPSFSEFLSFIVDEEPQDFDPHWMPIYQACGLCHVNYTAVVHTETFLEDIQYIMRVSGLDTKVNSSLLMENRNKGHGGDTHDLLLTNYQTIDPSLYFRVVRKYKHDFGLFGYDPGRLFQQLWPNSTIKWKLLKGLSHAD
ncbi:hypothetical protein OTU49_003051, partial [Cherax quadricarinatus]